MAISRVNHCKNKQVRKIFKEIAEDYERINSVISFGQIHKWRKELIIQMNLSGNQKVLDLGCGTGQLTKLIARDLTGGEIVGIDCTPKMIERARSKLSGLFQPEVGFFIGRGEDLDLDTNHFDLATSAFTLRNVEDIEKVLSEMKRVVRPGGRVLNLELSKPTFPMLRYLFFFYFNNILPVVGGMLHGDDSPYRYLAKSLQLFPDQENLKKIYEKAGLVDVYYKELFGGIAAIHCGKKRGNL